MVGPDVGMPARQPVPSLSLATVDLTPDVVQVVSIAQGYHPPPLRAAPDGLQRADLTTIVRVVHGCDASADHASRVAKSAIKIRNQVKR